MHLLVLNITPKICKISEGAPSTLQQVHIERTAKNAKPHNGFAFLFKFSLAVWESGGRVRNVTHALPMETWEAYRRIFVILPY